MDDKETTTVQDLLTSPPKVYGVPVWHYVVWCLGLLHDLGKIVIDMKVISADKNNECPPWDALNETLIEWSRENGVKSYRPIWNPHRNHQEHQSMSGALFQKIVSKAEVEEVFLLDTVEDYFAFSKGVPEVVINAFQRAFEKHKRLI